MSEGYELRASVSEDQNVSLPVSVVRMVYMCLMMNEDLSREIIYRGPSVDEQVRVSVNLSASEMSE